MAYTDILNVLKNPKALGVAAGFAGALSNTAGARTGTTTAMPTEAPGYSTLGDLLRKRAEARLRETYDLGGLEAEGIKNVNDSYRGAETAMNADLTSRGLGTSPIAGNASLNLQTSRAGDIASWLNQLPQIQHDMQNQDLQLAQGVYETGLGRTQTGTEPGSAIGSGIGSAAEMLAYLKGQGLLDGAKKVVGAVGGGVSDKALSAAFAGLSGAAGVAAPTAAEVASTVGTMSGLGIGFPAAGAAPGAAAGGGFGASLTALATNPITIGVAGALAAGAIWLKSQAHWEANTAVKDFENPFHEQFLAPFYAQWDNAIKSGRMNRQQAETAWKEFGNNWNAYVDKIKQWGQKGDKKQVALQSIQNVYDKVIRPQTERMQREIAALPA